MKLCLISDTHGLHDAVVVAECDTLIHAGDCCNGGSMSDLKRFAKWFEKQPAKHKVLVAGNHDRCFEKYPELARDAFKRHCPSGVYLQDSEVNVEGLTIWGSPWQPEFNNWAFNKPRDRLKPYWDMIPDNVDILVTHCPPFGFLDSNTARYDSRTKFGCRDLKDAMYRVRPLVHAFGHIHGGYGKNIYVDDDGHKTLLFNCSICTEGYYPTNQPHILDL